MIRITVEQNDQGHIGMKAEGAANHLVVIALLEVAKGLALKPIINPEAVNQPQIIPAAATDLNRINGKILP